MSKKSRENRGDNQVCPMCFSGLHPKFKILPTGTTLREPSYFCMNEKCSLGNHADMKTWSDEIIVVTYTDVPLRGANRRF